MATTAAEMLTLNPCRKMMVFGMDLGIESDTETDIVKTIDSDSNKRLCLEVDDDQDKGPVKKRRKQSKPVRIASSESLSDGENFQNNSTPDKEKTDKKLNGEASVSFKTIPPENNVNNMNSNGEYDFTTTNGNRDDSEKSCYQGESPQRDDDGSLLPINLSNSKSATNFLDSFVRSQVSESNQNVMNQVAQDTTTPSSYQETGFETMQYKKENVFVSSSSSPLSFPSVKPMHIPNSVPHASSPLRIFNPEAFCDLCNKEFCNKYFLKTHKANKHGIYIDNIGPNVIDALPSMPFINYFSSVNEVLPSSTHMSRTTIRKPQLSVCLSQQNANFSLKNSSMNGNTRAFCNICQREFCNKYFVRRHKAKIHGIMDVSFPDTPPNETQEQRSQNASDVRMINQNQDNKSDDYEIPPSLPLTRTVSNPLNVLSDKESKESVFRWISKEQMCNPEQQLQSVRLERDLDSDESTGLGMTGISNNASSQHSIFGNSQYHNDEIGKDLDSLDEKVKKVGIVNSEAFCDICCKEYCNKYFLRTHKMKSHGIITPDCDKRDERMSNNENSSNYSSQMMPLNLIVGEQNSEKNDKIFPHIDNGDIFCTICGQKFKNAFLLKMHSSYVHPQDSLEKPLLRENNLQVNDEKLLSKEKQIFKNELSIVSENSQKSIADEEKCFNFDFQNINSMTLKCEICHKNFDSASLEMHIENEHGNLLEEIGAMGEEDNSDSQLSLSVQRLKFDCSSCQKQFTNSGQLEQHIIDCHSSNIELQLNQCNNPSIKIIKDNEELLKNSQIQNMYSVAEIQTTPTSSFCEICKKELCNKYFMKTHMQRMHGISIENGAHIGGVVCDICNKELCSKYFLRVHKQNSHGIVDEVLGLDMSRNQSPNTDPSPRSTTEQSDLNTGNRYFSNFTEVCTICNRRFRSVKWLKAHVLNDHGEEGKEKWKELQVTFEMRQFDKYPKDGLKKSDSNAMIGNSFTNTSANSSSGAQKNSTENYQQRSDSSSCQLNGNPENNIKNSVFTTIFNGKSTNSKQYQCSYCSFSTTILAFLFVHERSHMGSSNLLLEPNQKLQCKICLLTFDNYDGYEKHSLSHNMSGAAGFSGDDHRGDSINKESLSQFLKQKEIPENENLVRKDASHLNERFSPTPRETTKCVNDVEIFELNTCTNSVVNVNYQKTNCEPRRQDLSFNDCTLGNSAVPEYLRKHSTHEERFKQEIEVDDEVNGALIQVKESLELIANRTEIPVSFSVPQSQKQVIMQPFVLEDSDEFTSPNNKKTGFKKSFLSSIVFLPVKERLKNPVMVSFKLTPT